MMQYKKTVMKLVREILDHCGLAASVHSIEITRRYDGEGKFHSVKFDIHLNSQGVITKEKQKKFYKWLAYRGLNHGVEGDKYVIRGYF